MNKFAVLSLVLMWLSFNPVLASTATQARAAQFSGASDEFQADIPEHRASWKIYMERALGYIKNGDFVEAQKMVDLARKEANATGQLDPSLAETEKMAGDIFLAQNNLDSAERSYRRSVYLFERATSPDKSEFAAALSSYASFLKNSNRIREASKFEARANLLRGNDQSTAESNRSL
jgi:tetratricopeptide (TPR) repeat protein